MLCQGSPGRLRQEPDVCSEQRHKQTLHPRRHADGRGSALVIQETHIRDSRVVQWLGLCAHTAGGLGLIPGWGTKIPHAVWHGPEKKEEEEMYIKTTPRYLYRPMRMTLIKMRNNIKKLVSAVISYTYTYILFHILFYYDLLQDTEYSSLCYTVGPCCSPVSYIVVCILYDSTMLCTCP